MRDRVPLLGCDPEVVFSLLSRPGEGSCRAVSSFCFFAEVVPGSTERSLFDLVEPLSADAPEFEASLARPLAARAESSLGSGCCRVLAMLREDQL